MISNENFPKVNKLKSYVVSELASGVHSDIVRTKLVNNGWSLEEIDAIFKEIEAPSPSGPQLSVSERKSILFSISTFIYVYTVIIFFSYVYAYSNSTSLWFTQRPALEVFFSVVINSLFNVHFFAWALVTTMIVSPKSVKSAQFVRTILLVMLVWVVLNLLLRGPYILYIFNYLDLIVVIIGMLAAGVLGLLFRKIEGLRSRLLKVVLLFLPLLIGLSLLGAIDIKSETIGSEDCGNFTEVSNRAYCYNHVAIQTNDLDLCFMTNIWSSELEKCPTTVFENLLQKDLANSSLCNGLIKEDARNFCVEKLAVSENDANICLTLSEQYLTDRCTAEIGKKFVNDIEQCEIISDVGANHLCVQRIAILKDDISLCDQSLVGPSGERGKAQCVGAYARSKGDISICNNELIEAHNEWRRESGYETDLTLEDDPGNMISYCYKGVAVTTNDSSVCEKIKSPSFKSYCLREVQ